MFKKHYPYRSEALCYVKDNYGESNSSKASKIDELTREVLLDFGRYLEQNFVSLPFQEDVDFYMVNVVYNGNVTRDDCILRVLTRRLYDFVEHCQTNRDTIMFGRLNTEKLCRHITTYDGTEIFFYDPLLKSDDYLSWFK